MALPFQTPSFASYQTSQPIFTVKASPATPTTIPIKALSHFTRNRLPRVQRPTLPAPTLNPNLECAQCARILCDKPFIVCVHDTSSGATPCEECQEKKTACLPIPTAALQARLAFGVALNNFHNWVATGSNIQHVAQECREKNVPIYFLGIKPPREYKELKRAGRVLRGKILSSKLLSKKTRDLMALEKKLYDDVEKLEDEVEWLRHHGMEGGKDYILKMKLLSDLKYQYLDTDDKLRDLAH